MELKGMSIDQFKEVVEFAQEHHAFAKWKSDEERNKEVEKYPNLPEYGYNIKYVDCHYDSRTSDVWSVKFRGFGGICFATNSFISLTGEKPKNFNFTTLFDWCMAYLKGEWKDESILKQCELKKDNQ